MENARKALHKNERVVSIPLVMWNRKAGEMTKYPVKIIAKMRKEFFGRLEEAKRLQV